MSVPCILCVEAAGDHRGQLVGLLEAEGFRVDLAEDGHGAMQRLQRRPRPALILVTLPGAAPDVPGVARMISKDPTLGDVPVVAVVDAGEPTEGFAGHLNRPVGAENLAACLDRLLGPGGADPLAPVRRNLRALIRAEGSAQVSLQEALDTLDELGRATPFVDAPRQSASEGYKP